MKKANFTLRSAGDNIVILYNGKPLKQTSNYKKALRIIALYINQKNIENFELFVYERNKLERVKDFDPEVVINHSAGKINRKTDDDFSIDEDDDLRRKLFNRDNDDDDDLNSIDESDLRQSHHNKFGMPAHIMSPHQHNSSWKYTPSDNDADIQIIKDNLKNMLKG